ncbi:MAG TPA: hypothetical protein VGH33_02610 [Isosphaeraceae bacterium]
MPETIQAPSGPMTLHVCRDGDAEGEGWVDVYETSFPPGQRQSIEEIRAQVEAGTMELDETRDQDGRIACMTVTEVFERVGPRFLLACYTATPTPLRSLGIGSVHHQRLVDLLEAEHPDHLGLFSEIESTREPGLDPQTLVTRQRRLAFFLRLDVRRLPIDYRFPSYRPDAPALQGELLWVPFAAPALDRDTLRGVLLRIYIEGYGLDPSAPFVRDALEIADRSWGTA